jgi:hypothetical protein
MAEHFAADGYEQETQTRYGATAAYQESQRRLAGFSPDQLGSAQEAQETALRGVIEVMERGFPATSLEAMVAAERCREAISAWYFECTPQMHEQLAALYLSDERFRGFYESRKTGLAQYFHDAIVARGAA